jgi:ABC-type uncharacterized transport system auxiliary subunit
VDGKPAVEGIQWADNLPKVIQEKVVQSFENANLGQSVSRPVEGATPDYQLMIDIRVFQINTEGTPSALVELGSRSCRAAARSAGSRVFRQTAPAKSTEAPVRCARSIRHLASADGFGAVDGGSVEPAGGRKG